MTDWGGGAVAFCTEGMLLVGDNVYVDGTQGFPPEDCFSVIYLVSDCWIDVNFIDEPLWFGLRTVVPFMVQLLKV